jgi:hypothetical protein
VITNNGSNPPAGLVRGFIVNGAWRIKQTVEFFGIISYYISEYYKIMSYCGRRIFVINMILSIFDTSK